MRKFFKSLAVLLALTLIVGVIPASAADQLTMVKSKTLYLNGSSGTKEDGTECKISYKKKVANMIKNFDADTMTIKLESDDEAVVATNKAGKIIAKSLGSATVTVTVYDEDENEILKQDLKVKVKKNATDVTVTGIADGDKFKVGQSVDVTLPRAGVDTDDRKLTVDKTDVAEITDGESARTYKVKFLKEGEATFTAAAYQSAKYPGTTASKTIKVTVGKPAPTDINVVASEAFELVFDTDVEAAGLFKDAKEIKTDAIYYMINDTKVPFSAVKAVKATGNTVKITMYDTFKAGETYYVLVNSEEPITFAIAGNGPKDVKAIKILTTTSVVTSDSASTDIKYALYNESGIDITTTALADANASVTLNAADGTVNAYVSAGTITMYTVGDTADVVATFKYYDPNNNYAETTLSTTQKITAVSPEAYKYSGFVYTIDPAAATRVLKNDESNAKKYMAMGDSSEFQAVLKYTKNNKTDKFQVGVDKFNGKNLFAKVADEAIAAITGNVGADFTIKANSVGTTNIFVGTTDDDTVTGKMTIIAVAPIEVKEKRYAATLNITTSQSVYNPANNDDSVTLKAEVKDQYGDYIDVTGQLETTQLKQSLDKRAVTMGGWNRTATGKYENKLGYGVAGSSIGDDTEGDNKKVRNIVLTTKINSGAVTTKANTVTNNFSVKNVAYDQAKDTLDFKTSKTALDTSLTKETARQKASITFRAYNGGYFTAK
ncbi:MAG: hypothetical protein K6F93_05155, partial [Lachnospiraceae bacterium]|nr:hypothetical protein [Lachnospiraceae bacterium]